MKELRR